MDRDSFANGYRDHAEGKDVPDEEIEGAFATGDQDGNGVLDHDEFMTLYAFGSNDEARYYWSKYAPYGAMDYENFSEGYREADEKATDEMINEAWNEGDQNRDKLLDLGEFMHLMSMNQGHEEEKEGGRRGGKGKDGKNDEAKRYWKKYSVSGMMDMGAFSEGYREADPEVS